MKRTRRQRKTPGNRALGLAPPDVDVEEAARQATYVGSAEHKDVPSFAGPPRLRITAAICDRSFIRRKEEIEQWLRLAIRSRAFSATWDRDFPRYVWHRVGQVVYEARHSGNGQYHGYPLDKDEWPEGLP